MEVDRVEGLAELGEEALQFGVGGQVGRRRGHRRGIEHRHPQFVGQHLHRGGQVEGTECGIRRNVHGRVAQLQFVVVQAGALAAEDERHLALRGGGDGPRRRVARRQFRQLHPPATRGATQHQPAVRHRLGQGREDRGRRDQVVGAGRHGFGIAVGRLLRGHQHQPDQPHGLHRPGRGADVARMLGTDEDDPEAAGETGFQRCIRRFIHGRMLNSAPRPPRRVVLFPRPLVPAASAGTPPRPEPPRCKSLPSPSWSRPPAPPAPS